MITVTDALLKLFGLLIMRCFSHLLLAVIFSSISSSIFACTDIFINKGGYHIQARTMDFAGNMASNNMFGFVGQRNTTDVVVEADKIPVDRLVSWTNIYGYFGRAAFRGPKIVDGMNTEGFSVATLILVDSKYPSYNSKDSRPVLAIYDLPTYLLSQVGKVSEALKLIRSHQLVQSAIEEKDGCFIKDIPIHFIMRDKTGDSAVIEFTNNQLKIYKNSGNVLANAPTFDWQMKHAKYYDSLLITKNTSDSKFDKQVYEYEKIHQTTPTEAKLLGMQGDFTSASRFARTKTMINNLQVPKSAQEALYQANSLINSITIPKLEGAESATIWSVIKDLDNQIFYIKDLGYFLSNGTFCPHPITNGYTFVDLKAINFKEIPSEYMNIKIQPTNAANIKMIISANDVPIFSDNKNQPK